MINCAHTFCYSCIRQWITSTGDELRTKKKCPICRRKIKSAFGTPIVDNLVEKIVESMNGEERRQRKKLLKKREKIVKKLNNENSE